jgi:zinc transport system permease protein
LLDDFVLRALLAGFGVAAVTGPLGCFVVWRRMAYFGESLAHTALLGIALGFVFGLNLTVGVVLACTAGALLLGGLERPGGLATDTLLGVLAHGSLALGLVLLGLLRDVRVDLMAYLFGDILAVRRLDLLWIWGGAAAVLAVLARLWRPLVLATLDADLARAEGLAVERLRLVLVLLMALTVAAAMKLVGVLLITALLIVPAAAARQLARTPEAMALLAVLAGSAAVAAGVGASLLFDTPAGPSVVVAALALFVLASVAVARPGARGGNR